jgi:hypothetical protein
MIIKIEGLPEGHKIKHMNVDITFEENGDVTINKKVEKVPEPPKLADVEPDTEPVAKPEIEHDDRPEKEIPKEMKDEVF